jgi:8-oxo-dGTP pyrophosphatase MutT (NUDIX family)
VKPPIQAAGGLVFRVSENGRREVLIVYRAHREDWTFPKGKLRSDENDEACARREVEEETGLRCVLGAELPTTTYKDSLRASEAGPVLGHAGDRRPSGSAKRGRRRALGCLGTAAALLTYARDRALLAASVRLRPDLTGVRPAGPRGHHPRSSRGRAGRIRAA